MQASDVKVGGKYRVLPEFMERCGNYHADQGSYIEVTANDNGYLNYKIFDKNSKQVSSCHACLTPAELQPYEKSLANLAIGDVLTDEDGDKVTVLAALNGPLYAVSDFNCPTSFGYWKTAADLESDGYTVAGSGEAEVSEMTVEEISKALGKTVKVVK